MRFSVTIDAAGLSRGFRRRVGKAVARMTRTGRSQPMNELPATSNLDRNGTIAALFADPWDDDEAAWQESGSAGNGDHAKT